MSKWIKCSDRLPEYEERVIMSCEFFSEIAGMKRGASRIGRRIHTDKKGDVFESDSKERFRTSDDLKIVTHWMQLPEPPK